MSERINNQLNELVLSPGEYAYTQDLTSGVLKIHTGPNVVNVTNQEYPVSFDSKTGRFKRVALPEASQQFVIAQQGQYIVLNNPAQDGKQPAQRDKKPAAELATGQRVIIQGPMTFALWPGQSAEVIEGHILRSNQYLQIRVRDEAMAKENWTKSVIKAAATGDDSKAAPDKDVDRAKTKRTTLFDSVPDDLTVGKHYIVRGDEFSFYIPPTGVEVLKDSEGRYVRDAVTLERLEYCILIDENGTKRYERGPQVVFPLPSERFHEELDSKGDRHVVFQPIELNEIQGIHVKVISDYTDENNEKHKAGDELFIRGDVSPIYFPRSEHSLVTYDRKHKTFATAVPAGEGRYVLERKTGIIETAKGPMMLLPDPRSQVIVRRVLTDKQCKLWYPGNLEAEKYNAALRDLARGTSSTRGAISEGEVTRSKKLRGSAASTAALGFADRSTTHSDTFLGGVDELERGATYQEPRTLTFETRYSGVPTIDLWTGYAVMVVSSDPNAKVKRRVEIGPKRLLLEYDEVLEVLSMSTGKPKNTDNLIQSVYLRVKNNQISDIVSAETKDHVNVTFKISLRGDFTGEPSRWFDAENYVKLVCDHVRSVVKAAVRTRSIEELYADPTGIMRDVILGTKDKEKRPGMLFEENGFHVLDVDVLGFTVGDDRISRVLDTTQHQVVESNIELALAEQKLGIEKRKEELSRELTSAKAETQQIQATIQAEMEKFNASLAADRVKRNLELKVQELESKLSELKKKEEIQAEEQRLVNDLAQHEADRMKLKAATDHDVQKALQDLALAKTREETKAAVERFQAAAGPLAEAMVALGNQDVLAKIAEATSLQHYIGGPNLVDALKKVFEGSPLAAVLNTTVAKAATKNGMNQLATAEKNITRS